MNHFLIKFRVAIYSSVNDALLGYEDHRMVVEEDGVGDAVVGLLACNAERLTVQLAPVTGET